jgi:preprotein translocase subunit YajC
MKVGDKVESYSGFVGIITRVNWRSSAGSTCCYIDTVEVKSENGILILTCPTYTKIISEDDICQ